MLCKEDSVQQKDTIWPLPFTTEIGEEPGDKFQTPGWTNFCQFSPIFCGDKMCKMKLASCSSSSSPSLSFFSSTDGSFVKIKSNNWCENALSSKDESSVLSGISLDWLYGDFSTVWWLIEVALLAGSRKSGAFVKRKVTCRKYSQVNSIRSGAA